jgi:hypothetical protein
MKRRRCARLGGSRAGCAGAPEAAGAMSASTPILGISFGSLFEFGRVAMADPVDESKHEALWDAPRRPHGEWNVQPTETGVASNTDGAGLSTPGPLAPIVEFQLA